MPEDCTHLAKEDVCRTRNDRGSLPHALGGAGNLDLQRQDLRKLKLTGVCLIGANLQGADLRGANLWGVDLCQANLRGANLCNARLSGAKLRGSDLSGADLSWTDLSGADLRGADLHQGNMRHANLSWADLRTARLEGIDLRGADLCGIELTAEQKVHLLQAGQDQVRRLYPPASTRGLLAAPRLGLISGLFLALALLTTFLVVAASVPLASIGAIVWLLLSGVTLFPWKASSSQHRSGERTPSADQERSSERGRRSSARMRGLASGGVRAMAGKTRIPREEHRPLARERRRRMWRGPRCKLM